ncbi:hypothetical protein DFH07DRAFT_917927 [Mycena maculata]|uniref:PX domain-containing protein n=1 Tax=Mycena maculata TaxID=230809 RepID=A0AAD7NI12_9AGAR|nr:hypothetical protein DFH07DRAFT_917927 [Mycena maculata]
MNINNMPGQVEGPAAPENWKRAVYRSAPSRFIVEMLPPTKLGGNYNFQMRICPVARGDRSSVSSRGSNTEYEILRRWEDCLLYQDTLEREYARLALSKRQRLVAGKGVKKNGMYLHDRASSWESLPPGPEPDSVAQSIHDLVPRLTKKGTVFRASQATTDQRQIELTAFVAALFKEDVPTLLEDFRKDRIVTDFFGFWRRDQDIQKASNKGPPKPRTSVTSSVFSTYFSAASDSREDVTGRTRALSSASSDSSSVLSSGSARSSISIQITSDDRPVAFGHNPHHGADTLEPLREVSELGRKPSNRGRGGLLAAVTKRVRRGPAEDSEGRRRDRQSLDEQPPRPDSRVSIVNNATTIDHHPHRESTASGMTFLADLNLTLPDEPDEDSRRSRMSMASIATFRTEVSSEGIIPRYYVPEPNPARLSTASFMTEMSADAILPCSSRRPDSPATLSQGTRRESFASVGSDGESVLDEYFYDAFPRPCSFIPEAPKQSRPQTPRMSPEQSVSPSSPPVVPHSPTKSVESARISRSTSPSINRLPAPPISPKVAEFKPSRSPTFDTPTPDSPNTPLSASFNRRKESSARARSPSIGSVVSSSISILSDSTMQSSFSDSTGTTITPSIYSFYSARSTLSTTTTSSSASSSQLVIKAAHNNVIILLRVEEHLPLSEIRQRLREKFLGQEGITLSETFALAYMIPASPAKASVQSRNRSNSLSTGTLTDTALVEMISTEDEWARLRSSLDGTKLTLRVMDSAS